MRWKSGLQARDGGWWGDKGKKKRGLRGGWHGMIGRKEALSLYLPQVQ